MNRTSTLQIRQSVRRSEGVRPIPLAVTVSVIFLMLLQLIVRAQEPLAAASGALQVAVSTSTNAIRIGDPVRLTISVEHPADGAIRLPDFNRGREIVVRNQKQETKSLSGNRARTSITIDFTSLITGAHNFSSGVVQCVLADGSELEQRIPAAGFEVTSLIGADTALRDAKGLARWPAAIPRWLIAFAAVAVAAWIGAQMLARFLSKRRTILQYPPPPPPHETALRALARLLSKGLIERGEVELFYVELSGIVRRYLEDRFDLRAPEQTTEEFIREATTSAVLSPEHRSLTCGFLEQCDLVKFARHRPGEADMRSGYAAAERLVKETIYVSPLSAQEAPTAEKDDSKPEPQAAGSVT